MFGIVIVAHGGLAVEYLSAMEHVLGAQNNARAISIRSTDDREEKRQEIFAAVDAVDSGEGVVVVTDMFGGTPSNLALSACDCKSRKVIYGANLPMLVKLAKARQRPVDEAIKCACEAGRKYLNAVRHQIWPCLRAIAKTARLYTAQIYQCWLNWQKRGNAQWTKP